MAVILWGSEQPVRPTGYGVVSREIIKRLVADFGHEIYVMGWDYNGEDFKHEEGWTMVHAGVSQFGAEKLHAGAEEGPSILDAHLQTTKCDIYVSLIDCWFIGAAIQSTNQVGCPYIAYTPVDGHPISHSWSKILAHVHTPLWMSEFGRQTFTEFVKEFKSDGDGDSSLILPDLDRYADDAGPMIYHGVDVDVFTPLSTSDKEIVRGRLGIEWDTTLLHVGRNTNRKQIPRLLEALRIALDTIDSDRSLGLILHVGDPTDTMGMGGWNLPELIKQLGLTGNVVFSDSTSNPLHGLSREDLAHLYGCADAHVLATGGEGFGVPSAEAMACGIPVILPDNSTGPELIGADSERGWLVPCITDIIGPRWGVKMGLVDVDALAEVLIEVHENPKEVKKRGKAGRKWVKENLDWDVITRQFHDLIESRIGMEHPMTTLIKQRGLDDGEA